ncbi:hypothetical protein Taro_051771 [Colocasia esculenta]|uniref:Uncharacterized protein n=1 Tax=Colocasia esculenta TaxID=4460 RepID=A0A843XHG0_COLES|nr:hypothetical protein [Colocasia esculenta]
MAVNARQSAIDSPRAEVGEIDTRSPFKSVKAAVSLFGQVKAFSSGKPAVKKSKPQPAESTLAKESELHLAQKELNKLREQLTNAETTRVQALVELENGEKTVQGLSNKLKSINESKELAIKATETAKAQSEQCEEVKSCDISENGLSWNLELDNAREQYTIIIAELDATKQELRKVKKDFETSTDSKVSAVQEEAEAKKLANANREKAAQLSKEVTAVQESLVHVKLAFLQAQQDESKILAEKDVSRQAHRHAMEETEKKLASLKNELDSELLGNLQLKLAQTEDEIGTIQKELENAKLSDMDYVASVAAELDGGKEVLQKVLEEQSSLRSSLESLRLELENTRKEQLKLKEKEAQTESAVANLQNKLKERKAELDVVNARELEARAACDELIFSVQTTATESENALEEAGLTKDNTEELKKDAEATRVAIDEAEKQLPVALKEAEDARIAEANPLSQNKVVSEKANAAQVCTPESEGKITISAEEHQSFYRIVEEAELLAETRVAAALAQVEAVRASENDAIKRLEAIQKEMEEIKSATEAALKTAEMAEAARTAVEGEMKRWREREQKSAAEAASQIFSETHPADTPTLRSRSLKSNPSENNEEKTKPEKTSSTKKALIPQLSDIFQRRKNKGEDRVTDGSSIGGRENLCEGSMRKPIAGAESKMASCKGMLTESSSSQEEDSHQGRSGFLEDGGVGGGSVGTRKGEGLC